MTRPAVHVVIVNWNSGDQLGQCLQSFASVAADAVDIARVPIVDNASVDGSLDPMAQLHSTLPLVVIRNPDNRGFGAACNQGARSAEIPGKKRGTPNTELRRY